MALRLEDDLALSVRDDASGQRLMDAQLLRSSREKTTELPRKKKVSKQKASKEQAT